MLDGVVEIPLSGQPVRPGRLRDSPCPPPLESFVAGPENRLVAVAVRSVLNDPDDGYSPIVLCGPSGSGKSHLAWGLAAAYRAQFRKRVVAYVPAVDFARQLAEAMQTKTLDDFRLRYRQAPLFILEDLEHLLGKPAAQRELTFTLDALEAAGGQVVITANRSPAELRGLLARLQSRLAEGLVVLVVRPGREARLAILERLADARGIKFAEGTLPMLANGLTMTVPELVNTITELEFSARTSGGVIGLDCAGAHLAQRNASRHPSVHEIALITARCFSLRLSDLRGRSRRRPTPTARALAMYFARNLTTQNLKQIGQYFGGRDHTTVSYNCHKTEERLRTEPELQDAVFVIQEEFQGI